MVRLNITLGVLVLGVAVSAIAQEQSLRNIRQLTDGGDNAEAYFSPDARWLTMQVTHPQLGAECDQIFLYDLASDYAKKSKNLRLVSTGKGRTTCSFFLDNHQILYSSTHQSSPRCPPAPISREGKYLWAIYPEFDIYVADLQGNIQRKLTHRTGYDAEATVSPDGKMICFTSMRSGDLELWIMDADGKNRRQITHELGYDGGAFFSPDGKQLVFRASRPKTEKEIAEYKALLQENLVAPTQMEIYTINVDGSNLKQITHLGKANWAPYFHPDNRRIIFSSNHHATGRGYDFQLYIIDTTGNNLRQITYTSEFNAFPMFSPDGKRLVFSSNRNQSKPRETNVFIADWVEPDTTENVREENLKSHLSYLTSDELNGRLAGSKDEKKAAKYLEKELKKLGLKTEIQVFDYSVRTHPKDERSSVRVRARNVSGFLDNNATQTIIIGAHYDHLGRNEHQQSTSPNANGQIHNGADDNASGVSAVLELARMLTTNLSKEKANYVFVFFSGEEDGLMGSKQYAQTIKNQYAKITAMINIDMVGRLDKDKNLTVGGVGSSPVFHDLIAQLKPAGFSLAVDESGVGPSDHTSFYLKDIPVLFLFTGTHVDYHKPSDDIDKINFDGIKHITQYVFAIADSLSKMSEVPFAKTKTTASKIVPKYKVTLGIMPSYADTQDGLVVDGVIEGRPAALAGLQVGDVIVQIGQCEVKEIYAYMNCLSLFNAGDEAPITINRNGEKKTLIVKF